MKIRAIIVDDEPLARERLAKLLRADPDIEVVGECADGRTAVEAIKKQRPELVFLDVQMPELGGFGVLSKLEPAETPAIVFVTAHDKFALKAFEVHAVDYLLKPFDRDRFQTALRRVKEKIRHASPTEIMDRHLAALIAELRPETKPPDRLAIKNEGRVVFLRFRDIDWIEAEGNYVKLHAGGDCHLMRESLIALEARLPAEIFFRLSRSSIVNADRIKELQPMFHGDCVVLLEDGTRLKGSRNYRATLEKAMG